jgi:hypothetical protein
MYVVGTIREVSGRASPSKHQVAGSIPAGVAILNTSKSLGLCPFYSSRVTVRRVALRCALLRDGTPRFVENS